MSSIAMNRVGGNGVVSNVPASIVMSFACDMMCLLSFALSAVNFTAKKILST
jgi:hypothetical protein